MWLFSLFLPLFCPAEEEKGAFYNNGSIWKNTDYLWSLSFLLNADRSYFFMPGSPFSTSPRIAFLIKENDVVFVSLPRLRQFAKNVFPKISHKFILVTGFSDISFPSYFIKDDAVIEMLASDQITHIFAQNFDRSAFTEKTTPIPLGIDFQYTSLSIPPHETYSKSPQQNEAFFKTCIEKAPHFSKRKVRILADFHLSNTSAKGPWAKYFGEDRQDIYNQLKNSSCIDFIPHRIPRYSLWQQKTDYLFSISPVGQGLDCHRTWEDLALGMIVIVKSSPLDPLYEGLPVVIVNNWNEICEENLYLWKEQFYDLLSSQTYREKLKTSYWIHKIK